MENDKRPLEYSLKKNGNFLDKPLIRLKNKTLLSWSVKPFFPLITNGFLKFSNIYVVIREDQDKKEFKNAIEERGIKVTSLKGSKDCPDHIFPNWFITFDDKTMQIFSMMAPNRRKEKKNLYTEQGIMHHFLLF